MIGVRPVQLIDMLRLDLLRIPVAPDRPYMLDIAAIVGFGARLQLGVAIALKIVEGKRLKCPLARDRIAAFQQALLVIPEFRAIQLLFHNHRNAARAG